MHTDKPDEHILHGGRGGGGLSGAISPSLSQSRDALVELYRQAIPEELKARRQFGLRAGKMPYVKNNGWWTRDGWNSPHHWLTFDEAIGALQKGEVYSADGITFFLKRAAKGERQIIALDFDCCVDPETGDIIPWARGLIERLKPFYTEVSISGTGIRAFVFGDLPTPRPQIAIDGPDSELSWEVREQISAAKARFGRGEPVAVENIHPKLEIFASNKHATLSGQRLSEFCYPPEDRNQALKEFLDEAETEDRMRQIAEAIERHTLEKGWLSKKAPIRIEDVIDLSNFKPSGRQLEGPHPVHGSSTGRNLVIDPDRNLWCCFHNQNAHGGGDAWLLLAVVEGIIDCKDARPGALRGEVLERTLDAALRRGLISEEKHRELKNTNLACCGDEVRLIEDIESIAIPENPRLMVNLEPDNLITIYIEYGKAACDAYPEYHYAGALVLLAVTTNRNLVLKLAQDDVYPNIWSFLLGRSTISRKSAAVKKCERILNAICPEIALPQSYSPEGLIEELAEKPRGYLIKDEAGAMLAAMQKNYMLEMRDLYCILYDNQSYKRKLRSGQRKERREFNIVDPFVNILTATTPQTFREHTQMIDLTSGWLLRFLYFYPNHKKEWMAFRPAGDEDFDRYGMIIGRLMKLKSILFNRTEPLEIKLSQEAWDYYQTWQRQREGELQDEMDDILLAFWGRLSFYVLKLAMLFTIGRADYSEGTEVSLKHVQEACRQVDEYFLPTAKIIAEEVAREESRNLQNRIISILKMHGGRLKKRDLLRYLHVTLREVGEALEALKASEEILEAEHGKATWIVLTSQNPGVTDVARVTTSQVSQEFNHCHGNSRDIRDTCDTCDTCDSAPNALLEGTEMLKESGNEIDKTDKTSKDSDSEAFKLTEKCGESEDLGLGDSERGIRSTEPSSLNERISELCRRGELDELSVRVLRLLETAGDHGMPVMEIADRLGHALPGEIAARMQTLQALSIVRNRGRDPKEPFDGDHWILVGGYEQVDFRTRKKSFLEGENAYATLLCM